MLLSGDLTKRREMKYFRKLNYNFHHTANFRSSYCTFFQKKISYLYSILIHYLIPKFGLKCNFTPNLEIARRIAGLLHLWTVDSIYCFTDVVW